jgi:hypothetical protein
VAADASFVRRNAFLIAAAVLPAIVVALFVGATMVSRASVTDPTHSLVLRVMRPDSRPNPTVVPEFFVRDGRVHATLRPAPAPYAQSWELLLYDHESMTVREIAFEVPESLPGDTPTTVPVESLASVHVDRDRVAPDGYAFEMRSGRAGIVGDLFGMHSYQPRPAIVKQGRVIPLDLPTPYSTTYAIEAIGWIR